jgi:hypothetical protein
MEMITRARSMPLPSLGRGFVLERKFDFTPKCRLQTKGSLALAGARMIPFHYREIFNLSIQ